ncbi:LysR family transcriptional regulator [Acuticoccus sp. M5D2P5]|uniref:LysR family transcriptional regulator n=1 Tax=Acuticoccus kalidii TaxID=2910977 RepID=UPI001F32775B|nr:LysR family transcriptional regulator [Acuticoccus kalidii]MCF3934062.1 LysR family transcriptional regulator [Acuticoccus kalidii]
MGTPRLADLKAFAAVARHRSFREAADALGLSRSALSHMVIGLERELGARLLNRTTRSVAPTEAGERLVRRLEPLLADLDAALDLTADAASGTVRINCMESAAEMLLSDVVPAVLEHHPHVAVDIATEGRLVDIVAAGFDAGVRLRESVPQDMIAVPFGGDARFLAVAAPSYLSARGTPTVPDDLAGHSCIRQRLGSGKLYRWEFARHGVESRVDVPGVLTLDNNRLMVAAARDGLGIAYVPEHFARAALREGSLVTVLPDWCPPIPGLCLYYPGNRHVPAPLRAFVDVLKRSALVRGDQVGDRL